MVCQIYHERTERALRAKSFPGVVTNVFEAVDIITLIKGNNYDELNLDVGEALKKRPDVGHKMPPFT